MALKLFGPNGIQLDLTEGTEVYVSRWGLSVVSAKQMKQPFRLGLEFRTADRGSEGDYILFDHMNYPHLWHRDDFESIFRREK